MLKDEIEKKIQQKKWAESTEVDLSNLSHGIGITS